MKFKRSPRRKIFLGLEKDPQKRIRKRYLRIQQQLRHYEAQLRALQEKCTHPNYQKDWITLRCPDCGHRSSTKEFR